MSTEFSISILARERPLNGLTLRIALSLPSGDLTLQFKWVSNALVQARRWFRSKRCRSARANWPWPSVGHKPLIALAPT
jgi:hypothetical protein